MEKWMEGGDGEGGGRETQREKQNKQESEFQKEWLA